MKRRKCLNKVIAGLMALAMALPSITVSAATSVVDVPSSMLTDGKINIQKVDGKRNLGSYTSYLNYVSQRLDANTGELDYGTSSEAPTASRIYPGVTLDHLQNVSVDYSDVNGGVTDTTKTVMMRNLSSDSIMQESSETSEVGEVEIPIKYFAAYKDVKGHSLAMSKSILPKAIIDLKVYEDNKLVQYWDDSIDSNVSVVGVQENYQGDQIRYPKIVCNYPGPGTHYIRVESYINYLNSGITAECQRCGSEQRFYVVPSDSVEMYSYNDNEGNEFSWWNMYDTYTIDVQVGYGIKVTPYGISKEDASKYDSDYVCVIKKTTESSNIVKVSEYKPFEVPGYKFVGLVEGEPTYDSNGICTNLLPGATTFSISWSDPNAKTKSADNGVTSDDGSVVYKELSAVYVEDSAVNVTYDYDGGTVSGNAPVTAFDREDGKQEANVVITDVVPVKKGNAFKGWSVNGSTKMYKAGDVFTTANDVTVKALYDVAYGSYTVVHKYYDINGSTRTFVGEYIETIHDIPHLYTVGEGAGVDVVVTRRNNYKPAANKAEVEYQPAAETIKPITIDMDKEKTITLTYERELHFGNIKVTSNYRLHNPDGTMKDVITKEQLLENLETGKTFGVNGDIKFVPVQYIDEYPDYGFVLDKEPTVVTVPDNNATTEVVVYYDYTLTEEEIILVEWTLNSSLYIKYKDGERKHVETIPDVREGELNSIIKAADVVEDKYTHDGVEYTLTDMPADIRLMRRVSANVITAEYERPATEDEEKDKLEGGTTVVYREIKEFYLKFNDGNFVKVSSDTRSLKGKVGDVLKGDSVSNTAYASYKYAGIQHVVNTMYLRDIPEDFEITADSTKNDFIIMYYKDADEKEQLYYDGQKQMCKFNFTLNVNYKDGTVRNPYPAYTEEIGPYMIGDVLNLKDVLPETVVYQGQEYTYKSSADTFTVSGEVSNNRIDAVYERVATAEEEKEHENNPGAEKAEVTLVYQFYVTYKDGTSKLIGTDSSKMSAEVGSTIKATDVFVDKKSYNGVEYTLLKPGDDLAVSTDVDSNTISAGYGRVATAEEEKDKEENPPATSVKLTLEYSYTIKYKDGTTGTVGTNTIETTAKVGDVLNAVNVFGSTMVWKGGSYSRISTSGEITVQADESKNILKATYERAATAAEESEHEKDTAKDVGYFISGNVYIKYKDGKTDYVTAYISGGNGKVGQTIKAAEVVTKTIDVSGVKYNLVGTPSDITLVEDEQKNRIAVTYERAATDEENKKHEEAAKPKTVKYTVMHRYYLVSQSGQKTEEGSYSQEYEAPVGTLLSADNKNGYTLVNARKEHIFNGNQNTYTVFATSGDVKLTESGTVYTMSYSRQASSDTTKMGSYVVYHDLYKLDGNGQQQFVQRITDEIKFAPIGKKVGISANNQTVDIEVQKVNISETNNGIKSEYVYQNNTGTVVIEAEKKSEITLTYLYKETAVNNTGSSNTASSNNTTGSSNTVNKPDGTKPNGTSSGTQQGMGTDAPKTFDDFTVDSYVWLLLLSVICYGAYLAYDGLKHRTRCSHI